MLSPTLNEKMVTVPVNANLNLYESVSLVDLLNHLSQ
jgi:hypothetical protein